MSHSFLWEHDTNCGDPRNSFSVQAICLFPTILHGRASMNATLPTVTSLIYSAASVAAPFRELSITFVGDRLEKKKYGNVQVQCLQSGSFDPGHRVTPFSKEE